MQGRIYCKCLGIIGALEGPITKLYGVSASRELFGLVQDATKAQREPGDLNDFWRAEAFNLEVQLDSSTSRLPDALIFN